MVAVIMEYDKICSHSHPIVSADNSRMQSTTESNTFLSNLTINSNSASLSFMPSTSSSLLCRGPNLATHRPWHHPPPTYKPARHILQWAFCVCVHIQNECPCRKNKAGAAFCILEYLYSALTTNSNTTSSTINMYTQNSNLIWTSLLYRERMKTFTILQNHINIL